MLDAILGLIKPVIGSLFPNPEDKLKAEELQNQITLALMNNQAALDQAAASNVKAEIASSSWLARNWRPIMMMTFLILIVFRWFGWNAPAMSPAEYIEAWGLLKLGMGGYIGGRTIEKVTPVVADAFKSSRK